MIRISPSTAAAIALHAATSSWVVFVQVRPPAGECPIKIEAIAGTQLLPRMRSFETDNPFDVFLIGLIATPIPQDIVAELAQLHADQALHDGWYQPSANLLSFIEEAATPALSLLLGQTHPAGLEDAAVDIQTMAQLLDVSVPTIRRMIAAKTIPYLRWGKIYRFVPDDVFASLAQQGR